ncbi:MAG: hypothetical protein MR301_07690 [Prevotella sp.]|nr:hypothetical protein [Prevotella sp.]MDD7046696.1 hypothetical protein [Prevotella sp.]
MNSINNKTMMKKYEAPQIEVTKIATETAILAASLEQDWVGDIDDSKKILSNRDQWLFMEEEEPMNE